MLLDETVRKNCNEVGGYWFKKNDDWFCRLPADVVEKAVDEVKEIRESTNRLPPCLYFHGEHKSFVKNKNVFEPVENRRDDPVSFVNFKRLGFDKHAQGFRVCDIPYENKTEFLFPLLYPVAFNALKRNAHLPEPEDKVYDNYYPEYPQLLFIQEPTNFTHYHLNFEGSQEKLFEVTKEYVNDAVIYNEQTRDELLREHEQERRPLTKPIRYLSFNGRLHWFEVLEQGKPIFAASLYPGEQNAVPRIKITKTSEEFDRWVIGAVEAVQTAGQLIGRPTFVFDQTGEFPDLGLDSDKKHKNKKKR